MSSIDFMFTPTVQRVLRATLLNPERKYSLGALLDIANTGRGSTQKQIERLLAAGILKENREYGRLRQIYANKDHFLYSELTSIAKKTFGITEPIRDVLAPFSKLIDEAYVFGSIATEKDSSSSDIDLMIIGKLSVLDIAEPIHTMEGSLGRPINFTIYKPSEWKRLIQNDPICRQINEAPKLMVLPDAKTG
ncbi:nucleotidyltransferase domain-containing protein [uncultured Limnobacter sp.]|uniref:nucleotidyltransferase domain-containing protein n=1 Tax=Limnobacter sp. TaxID=2003368 RepID=UPI0030F7E659